MSPKSAVLWVALGLLSVLPYLFGIQHEFVYDDHGVIVENPFFDEAGAWWSTLTLQTLFRHDVIDGQRPVVIATYFTDRFAWGLWPVGYRITNLLFHLSVVLMLAAWLLRLTGRAVVAFGAALLFAWHPLLIEAVQSPSFREDILYTCFGFAYLLAGSRKSISVPWLVGGMAAYAMALLSKESAFIFPPLLLLTWWLFPAIRPPKASAVLWMTVSVVITLALLAMIAIGRPVQAWGSDWNGLSLQGSDRLWTAPWLFARTLGTMVIPYPLSVDYRLIPVSTFFDVRFILGVAAVVGVIVLCWRLRHCEPVWSLALAWLVIAFVPVSNLVPLLNPVADRYAYGMLPGFVLLFAAVLHKRSRHVVALLGAVMMVFLLMTMNRLQDWKDDHTLWTAAYRVQPESARARTWLGLLDQGEKKFDSAWEHFIEAERLNPHDVTPKVNRAILLGQQGDLAGAEKLLREVLDQRPDHQAARENLALSLMLQGKEP